ncbi:hypothetical protein RYX36_014016 [Vicia faba]
MGRFSRFQKEREREREAFSSVGFLTRIFDDGMKSGRILPISFHEPIISLLAICFSLLWDSLIQGLVEELAKGRIIQQIEVHGLKKLLEKSHSALEIMEECVFQLTNEFVVTYIHHFEESRKRMALLYPRLDLSPLYPFKVVLNGEMVDGE